jgi:hypothetical protein
MCAGGHPRLPGVPLGPPSPIQPVVLPFVAEVVDAAFPASLVSPLGWAPDDRCSRPAVRDTILEVENKVEIWTENFDKVTSFWISRARTRISNLARASKLLVEVRAMEVQNEVNLSKLSVEVSSWFSTSSTVFRTAGREHLSEGVELQPVPCAEDDSSAKDVADAFGSPCCLCCRPCFLVEFAYSLLDRAWLSGMLA